MSNRSRSLPATIRNTLARDHRRVKHRLRSLRVLTRAWYLQRAGRGRVMAFRERWRHIPLFAHALRESGAVNGLTLEQITMLAWAASLAYRDSFIPPKPVRDDFRLMFRRLDKAYKALLDVYGVTATRFQPLTPLVEATIAKVDELSRIVVILSLTSQRRFVKSFWFLLGGPDAFSYVASRVLADTGDLKANEVEIRIAKMERAISLHGIVDYSEASDYEKPKGSPAVRARLARLQHADSASRLACAHWDILLDRTLGLAIPVDSLAESPV